MDRQVSEIFSRYGLEGYATIGSGSARQDGDRIIGNLMREDKHRDTEGWSIGRSDFQKSHDQALRQGKSLLFVNRYKHVELLVTMTIEQFLPLLAQALQDNG